MKRTICAAIALCVSALSAVPSRAVAMTVELTSANTATVEAQLAFGPSPLPQDLQTFNNLAGSFSDGWYFTSNGTPLDFAITTLTDVSGLTISLYRFPGSTPAPPPGTLVGTGVDTLVTGSLLLGDTYFIDLQGFGNSADASVEGNLSATPLPAALPLYAAGIGVMGLLGRRRKRKP
jgi:hypothetical protein